MSFRRSTILLAALALCAASFAGAAAPALAQSVGYYAGCTACHTLPYNQASGFMDVHSGTYYPGFPEEACYFCHDPYPHDGPSWPAYWWNTPLDPYSFPAGPSLNVQACDTCHDRTQPPLSTGHHPVDTIPYASNPAGYNPPQSSVLPLFMPDGFQVQDPYNGGMVCSTCHDPHEPSYQGSTPGHFTFLRIGDEYTGVTNLCTYCHDDKAPPPFAYDLFIDSDPMSVAFRSDPYAPEGFLMVEVTVTNRGNSPYYGGALDVMLEREGIPPSWLGSFPIPFIAPDQSAVVPFPWDSTGLTESVAFHFILDGGMPPPLNTARPPEFIRVYSVIPPPEGLMVMGTTLDAVDLAWAPPAGYGGYVEYHVYRDGSRITPWPVPAPYFTDAGLSPETPHTYTVKAVTPEGQVSAMSARVAAMTDPGYIVRVPQDFPTIQAAVDASWPGTSIHVAPGVYDQPFHLYGRSGVSVIGQDAAGCILDFSASPGMIIDLDLSPGTANSISGFTIVGGSVGAAEGDTVRNCVFRDSPWESVYGGGLVTNCVFDSYYPQEAILVDPSATMLVANSIFLTPFPLYADTPSNVTLLHNDFVFGFDWTPFPGEGNFTYDPMFDYPGPPESYFLMWGSLCQDSGADMGLPAMGVPDVGAFELGFPYTSRPPTDLAAAWDQPSGAIHLTWSPSPDDPFFGPTANPIVEYLVYRSETGDFLPDWPYAFVPAGQTEFFDAAAVPGIIYLYQVRASTGYSPWPLPGPVVSAPTNTVSAQTNTPPTAGDDFYSVPEDTLLTVPAPGVLGNDTDLEGGPLTASLVTPPLYGALLLNPDGSFSYDPAPGFYGPDSFTYTAFDGDLYSAEAVVTLTVEPVNDPPVLAPVGPREVGEGSILDIPLAASDGDAGDTLAFAEAGLPPFCSMTDFGDGTAFIHCEPGFTDAGVYPVSVTVTDSGTPPLSDAGTFDLTVSDTNRPPVAVGDSYGTDEDSALIVPAPGVLLNDGDPDLDALSASAVTGPASGSLAFNADGSFSYTPAPDFFGTDSFTYTASDGALSSGTATVTITVASVNDAPVLQAIGARAVGEGGVLSVPLAASDVDGDALSLSAAGLPAFCVLADGGDGTGSLDCAPGFTDAGVYPVSVTVTDSGTPPLSDSETFDLTVSDTNRPPVVADPGPQAGSEGDAVSLQIAAADPDGDTLAYSAAGLPPGLALDGVTGLVTGTISHSGAGSHSVTVTVSDGAAAADVVFSWTVTDVPVMRVDSIAMGEYVSKGKTYYTALVLVLDDTGSPAGGATVTGHWAGLDADPAPSALTTGGAGTAAFETNGLRKPSGVYTFTVDGVARAGSVYDAGGSVTSGQYPPPPVPRPPSAADDSASTAPGVPVVIDVLANDSDPDGDALVVTNLTQPAHGTAVLGAGGAVTYSPAAGFTGLDSFTYTANDGTFDSGTAVVTVTVSEPPAGGVMHVASIAMSVSGKKVVKAGAVVTVVDAAGAPVEGAAVSGAWSGAAPGTSSGITGPDGTVSLASPGVKDASGQTSTFTVTDAAKDGWTYDAAANVETSDSVTAP